MKVKYILLVSLFVLVGGLLSACSGTGAVNTWAGMTADETYVYLAGGSHVYTVRLSDGSEFSRLAGGESQPLRFPENAETNLIFYATPTFTGNGQLIVGSVGRGHGLYSINVETFRENWSFTQAKDVWVGSVLVTGERIFAPSGDSNLYALDLQGNLIWTFKDAKKGLWSQPVTDGERLYFGSLDHQLFAVDPATGRSIWTRELDGAILDTPALSSEGLLYVGTLNKTVYALQASNGEIVWQKSVDGWVWSGPLLAEENGRLYFGVAINSNGGKFYTLNAADGSEIWSVKTDGAIIGRPVVQNEIIIAGTEAGTVYAFDLSGAQAWKETVGGKVYSSPILAGDLILVAPMGTDHLLVALDANGNEKWVFTPEK